MKKIIAVLALLLLVPFLYFCAEGTYEAGYKAGYAEGNSKGYYTGYKLGRSGGYDDGYFDGYRAAGGSFADDLIKKFHDEHPTLPQD